MTEIIPDSEMVRFGTFVADTLGLHFPTSRWADLQRGIVATATELGFKNASACAQWFVSSKVDEDQLQTLAANLTVGETYFFRDAQSFQVLADHILPQIVAARRSGERRLRIWSAACCTGEEAYSIAIVLHRTIPDLENWNITLLATDINLKFLRKATAGVFGQWSFRDSPDWLKPYYFRPVGQGQFEIIPAIKRMVRFTNLNLVEDVYPSLVNDTNAMDLIFCRNVLMYFSAAQAERVVEKFYQTQLEGGWLVVSATELMNVSRSAYTTVALEGTTVYRKEQNPVPRETIHWRQPVPTLSPELLPKFEAVPQEWKSAEVETTPEPAVVPLVEQEAFEATARDLANQGQLREAMDCCDRWIAANKLDPATHYLRAVILQEQGRIDDAVQSLRAVIYLDPKFVLAYVMLGRIAHHQGDGPAAVKHLAAAEQLLREYGPEEVVPESDGMVARRMREMIDLLISAETL